MTCDPVPTPPRPTVDDGVRWHPACGPTDAAGVVWHEGDPTAQLALSLANALEALHSSGGAPSAVTALRVHTTDVDAVGRCLDVATEHLRRVGAVVEAQLVEVVEVAGLGHRGQVVAVELASAAAPTDDPP